VDIGFRVEAVLAVSAALVLFAVGVLAVLSVVAPGAGEPPLGVIAVTGLSLLPELATRSRSRSSFCDVLLPSEAVLALGLAFASPAALVAGRLLAAGTVEAGIRRRHPAKVILNMTLGAAETLAAAAVYRVVVGAGVPGSAAGYAGIVLGVAAAVGLGLGTMTVVGRLHQSRPPSSTVRALVSQASLGLLAGLVAVATISMLSG
jgi:hypothetical protein